MKIRNIILSLVLGVAVATGVTASAKVYANPGDTPTCKFTEEGLGKGFVKGTNSKGDTISISFNVEGDANCRKDFVLSAFTVPHKDGNPYPLEDQKLFAAAKLKDAQPGTHTMTVNVPKCFYQVDLALGLNPTGPNGKIPFEPGRLLNAYLGGHGLKCEATPPTTPPTTPPATPASTTQTVTKLTNTGPSGVVATAMSVAAAAGTAHYMYNRRRQLSK